MKRLLIFLLFATSAAARPHDYTLHAPKIPPFHAIKVTPLVFAQTNTFCAANLACTVTGAWTFSAPFGATSVKTLNSITFADQFSTTATVAAPVNAASTSQVATGGSVAANNYKCEVTFNGGTSGETTPSPPAAGAEVTGGATTILYCVQMEFPPPAGAVSYNVYWQTGGAGNYFLGHSSVALNLQDQQTTTPPTSGTQPPVSNTAIGILPSVQAATGAPGAEIIPATVPSSAGAPGIPLGGQTFLDFRNGNIISRVIDGHPWVLTAPGNFTGRTTQGLFESSVNGCNPEQQFRLIFTGQNGQQAFANCVTIPPSSTTFQVNADGGFVENQSGAATAAVALFGGARITTTSGGRAWGINTVATDVTGITSTGIYGSEFDININNAASIAHGVFTQALFNVQPTDSRAFEIGQPIQTGAVCSPNCVWPFGFYVGVAATGVPSVINGHAAILFNPVATGTNQPSQGMSFAAFDPVSGTNYAAIKEQSGGDMEVLNSKAGTGIVANNFFASPLLLPGLVLNASGANFGFVQNQTATTFCLAHGGNRGVIGTCDFTWGVAGLTVDNSFTPDVAGTRDLGTTALPFGNLWLGTAATNNFKFQPAATAAARVITMADPLQATVALPMTIVSGTKTLNTASITTATCDAGLAATATGALATDVVDWSFAAAPTTANKYGAFLQVYAVPSANVVTFYTCNPSATTSTPTAMTINWSVRRP